MKALGAYQWQIALLFYCEAIISALIGGDSWLYCGLGLSKIYWLCAIWRTTEFCLDCHPLRIDAVYFNCCGGHLVPSPSYCQTLPCGGAVWPPIKVCFGV